jgi:hypothetical protein
MADEGCVTGDGRQQFAPNIYTLSIYHSVQCHVLDKGILKNEAVLYDIKRD